MSPYGMKGGDTKETDKWMESCVTSIKGTNKKTGKPYTEGDKIAICKATYMKKKESRSDVAEFDGVVDLDIEIEEEKAAKIPNIQGYNPSHRITNGNRTI